MTYDELLAKLWDDYANFDHSDYPTEHIEALRAVVKLHKPMTPHCENCNNQYQKVCECGFYYPCETIRTIEKVLE